MSSFKCFLSVLIAELWKKFSFNTYAFDQEEEEEEDSNTLFTKQHILQEISELFCSILLNHSLWCSNELGDLHHFNPHSFSLSVHNYEDQMTL
jgi:hypothetical protein